MFLILMRPSFFFQAEDGIRDLTVTGVQTCALPISRLLAQAGRTTPDSEAPSRLRLALRAASREIGRASCRERELFGGGRGAACGSMQGDVLATDNTHVGVGDVGILSAIHGSTVQNS